MLGQEVQTKRLPPVFPLLFHEKLTFQKTFSNAGCLAEVQDSLGREDVYAVLLQEVEDSSGGATVQLARFHTTALQILYPSPCSKGLLAGVDVNLLMEASSDYPGILCPKIELSTKTVIEEVTSSAHDGYIINPKTLSSQRIFLPKQCNSERDSRMNHSEVKQRFHSNPQPHPGRKMKHSQNVASGIIRAVPCPVPGRGYNVNGHLSNHSLCTGKCGIQDGPNTISREICQCEAGHLPSKCPLCTHYKAIFGTCSDYHDTNHGNQRQYSECCTRKQSLPDAFERTKRPTCGIGTSKPSEGQNYDFLEVPKRGSESDPCFKATCGSGDEVNSHRQLFYANLEKFYRKLYDRARTRAQEENRTEA
ncbi:Spermatogenesis associated 6-like protein [Frankliniella fusca]|uniref:Spermatogenesis associated 6-like protein n=1 Tax=Frankliniella fusca TaxID=407009 RepID=A0AAE1GZT5_9NEOP|nr:Spermatogenesis associated 6-like protein [Frankliniella fusca]